MTSRNCAKTLYDFGIGKGLLFFADDDHSRARHGIR
jgi:hypothetical protein